MYSLPLADKKLSLALNSLTILELCILKSTNELSDLSVLPIGFATLVHILLLTGEQEVNAASQLGLILLNCLQHKVFHALQIPSHHLNVAEQYQRFVQWLEIGVLSGHAQSVHQTRVHFNGHLVEYAPVHGQHIVDRLLIYAY
ncbi:hypothetical protein BpHYR1_020156 [Brachionus plicatilis]|uniref:Uncharacterized protein n=1 Tax=Brachionus plicatilis TaxID=10195 RepID=A0A3M7PYA0_BRAPC|nr:hypothetical protein BpHYR1_020156 [Brachionus plicatilis]